MNLNENIANAVVVLQKTNASVNKMLEQCKAISERNGYILKSDKILRWRSDVSTDGWLLNSLILVFQKNSDPDCPSNNGWKDGPIYAVQVFLGSAEEPDLPAQLYVSRFDYADINDGWTGERLSPADHWAFYDPTHSTYSAFRFTEKMGFFESEPIAEKYSHQYWGLIRTVWKTFPLSSVTADTLGNMVFETFDELESVEKG